MWSELSGLYWGTDGTQSRLTGEWCKRRDEGLCYFFWFWLPPPKTTQNFIILFHLVNLGQFFLVIFIQRSQKKKKKKHRWAGFHFPFLFYILTTHLMISFSPLNGNPLENFQRLSQQSSQSLSHKTAWHLHYCGHVSSHLVLKPESTLS